MEISHIGMSCQETINSPVMKSIIVILPWILKIQPYFLSLSVSLFVPPIICAPVRLPFVFFHISCILPPVIMRTIHPFACPKYPIPAPVWERWCQERSNSSSCHQRESVLSSVASTSRGGDCWPIWSAFQFFSHNYPREILDEELELVVSNVSSRDRCSKGFTACDRPR